MKKIFSLLLFSYIVFSSAFAQNPQTYTEENDPAAKAVFEKIKKKYDAFDALKVDVSIEIKIPEQAPIKQNATLIQKGEKYKLELPDQLHVSNGEQLWLYLKEKNQVQIHSLGDEEDGIITPKDLLRFYERDDFFYALTNEFFRKKKTIQQIELKPLDRDDDIMKFKVEVDKKTSEIISIKAFFSDGVRYQVFIDKLTPNPTPIPDFKFTTADFPNIEVEDLRID